MDSALHCVEDGGAAGAGGAQVQAYSLREEREIGGLLDGFLQRSRAVVQHGWYPTGRELALDEAMVRFQGRFRKVYRRQPKPTSEGMKLVAVCDARGFVLDAVLAAGPGSAKEAGMTVHDTVMHLASRVPRGSVVYMDKYFCSVATLQCMAEKHRVLGCGTLRKRRGVPPHTGLDATAPRGTFRFAMGVVSPRVRMVAGCWRDSAVTRFASTAHSGDAGVVLRRVAGVRGRVPFSAPRALVDYNRYMRGVDLADQRRACLTVQRRTRKWWRALFAWWLDSVVVSVT